MPIQRVVSLSSTGRAWARLLLFLHAILLAASWSPANLRYSTRLDSTVDPQQHKTQACQSSDNDTTPASFAIRPCRYADLPVVSDIIINSFYQTSPYPFKHLYLLAELNRLQQNFPYNDAQRHVMLVATTIGNNEVVAFCDIDARPATRAIDPPRPYLSDLAVRPDCRRRGIAKHMVQECERIATHDMNRRELYIRVEENNTAAVQMYNGLGYEPLGHHIFGVQDTTVLLRKYLMEPDAALDYVV